MTNDMASEIDKLPVEQRPRLGIAKQLLLAILCLGSGVAPLVARWIPDGMTKIAYSLLLTLIFLTLTLLARKKSPRRIVWELPFAFFVLALVQVLYDFSPYFGTYVLHETPIAGNPLASTLFGTLAVQLYETFAAIIPVIVLTRVSGMGLGSIYARKGRLSRWFIVVVAAFLVFYLLAATGLSSGLFPTNGSLTPGRMLALTPALLVMVISNGFQEEFLLRGLFLQKYEDFFGAKVSNVLQAAVFAIWHLGVTYTPGAVFFIVVFVFPLGLFAGYLMRHTNGILAPGLFHAGSDIPIFLAFLSYVS